MLSSFASAEKCFVEGPGTSSAKSLGSLPLKRMSSGRPGDVPVGLQVLGQIAGDGRFGEDDDLRAVPGGFADKCGEFPCVARNIAEVGGALDRGNPDGLGLGGAGDERGQGVQDECVHESILPAPA
jgi:hypothetical protein